MATLASRLSQVMAEHRPPITQQALAERVGVTQPAVAGWLEGTIPYPKTLNRICAALGVRRDWLLYGEGRKNLPGSKGRLVLEEAPPEYNLKEKVAFIEERGTPEQLALIDSFLESVREQLVAAPDGKPSKRTRRS